ncbi:MAG: hypothetical protein P8172_16790 [Gammaproteobacteria bacterium]
MRSPPMATLNRVRGTRGMIAPMPPTERKALVARSWVVLARSGSRRATRVGFVVKRSAVSRSMRQVPGSSSSSASGSKGTGGGSAVPEKKSSKTA